MEPALSLELGTAVLKLLLNIFTGLGPLAVLS